MYTGEILHMTKDKKLVHKKLSEYLDLLEGEVGNLTRRIKVLETAKKLDLMDISTIVHEVIQDMRSRGELK